LILAPWRLANDYSPTYDTNCPILNTSGTYTGGGGAFFPCDSWAATVPITGIQTLNVNTEYSSAMLAIGTETFNGVGIRYRLVAAVMRMRYIGRQADLSGLYGMYQSPDHSSITSLSFQTISNYPSFCEEPIESMKWTTLTYCPVLPEEYDYTMDGIVNNASVTAQTAEIIANNTQLNHYMGMMVYGAQPLAPFQVEIVQHFEITGQIVSGKTVSKVDSTGLGIVANAFNTANIKTAAENPIVLEKLIAESPESATVLAQGMPKKVSDGLNGIGSMVAKTMEFGDILSDFV